MRARIEPSVSMMLNFSRIVTWPFVSRTQNRSLPVRSPASLTTHLSGEARTPALITTALAEKIVTQAVLPAFLILRVLVVVSNQTRPGVVTVGAVAPEFEENSAASAALTS